MNKFLKYHEAVAFLEGLSNMPVKKNYAEDRNQPSLYLERMKYFLKLLKNPHEGFKFVHITGTAGKGTVATMVFEMLQLENKKVGLFTSPFATTSIEKIKDNDGYIEPDTFADIVEGLKPFLNQAHLTGPYGRPSYFEIFLAIAFIYFKMRKLEYVVLEVGMGGRYDATNIISNPLVTAITNIDYDHTKVLGKTLNKIAYDKAGIIKKGGIFWTSEERRHILDIFRSVCKSNNTTFNHIPKHANYREYNLALSANIANSLGVSSKHIEEGAVRAKLPCRFETMQKGPIVVLDGAHNRAKIRSTVSNLKEMLYAKLFLIIGMAHDKDSNSILREVVPRADYMIFTRFQIKDRKCADPVDLERRSVKFKKKSAKTEVLLDPKLALKKAIKMAGKNDLILVTGSFFLAGELRKGWFSEEYVLRNRKSF